MFRGIHDSEVVAYSVDSRAKELVLTLEPAKGTAQKGFAILFSGVAAHQFEYPLIPSIVLDLIEIETSDLLAREWTKITKGCHQCGWPGAWATSLEAAVSFCNSQMLKGYQLEQSYGMSGWVLAKAVRCVGNP